MKTIQSSRWRSCCIAPCRNSSVARALQPTSISLSRLSVCARCTPGPQFGSSRFISILCSLRAQPSTSICRRESRSAPCLRILRRRASSESIPHALHGQDSRLIFTASSAFPRRWCHRKNTPRLPGLPARSMKRSASVSHCRWEKISQRYTKWGPLRAPAPGVASNAYRLLPAYCDSRRTAARLSAPGSLRPCLRTCCPSQCIQASGARAPGTSPDARQPVWPHQCRQSPGLRAGVPSGRVLLPRRTIRRLTFFSSPFLLFLLNKAVRIDFIVFPSLCGKGVVRLLEPNILSFVALAPIASQLFSGRTTQRTTQQNDTRDKRHSGLPACGWDKKKVGAGIGATPTWGYCRSEEHTSELQSRLH